MLLFMPYGANSVIKLMINCLEKIHRTLSPLSLRTSYRERYTKAKRSQHITQIDTRVYSQSHIVNTSFVYGNLAFLNKPAQHDYVDFFQSFAKFRERGLSRKIPAEKEASIRQDP